MAKIEPVNRVVVLWCMSIDKKILSAFKNMTGTAPMQTNDVNVIKKIIASAFQRQKDGHENGNERKNIGAAQNEQFMSLWAMQFVLGR